MEKGSAGGRQDDPLDIFPPVTLQTLEDRAVLAVDGNDLHPLLCCLSQHDVSRHHQRLFIRQGDILSRLNCIQGRKQSGRADHGGNDHIGI